MNPYSQLGIDQTTEGYLSGAGIDPTANFQQSPGSATGSLSAYPTYPNAAGVGSQTAGAAPTAPAVNAPVVGGSPTIPDASARGLSPYSLLGDANYRGK
jgi:hypothetical protein